MRSFATTVRVACVSLLMLCSSLSYPGARPVAAQSPQRAAYPPLAEYLMARDAEVVLARTAAPERVSARATIKVLTASGYEVASKGDNGFVCLVMRGWSAPTFTPAPFRDFVYSSAIRAPICFDPIASRTVLPLQELRARLGMQGKDPEAIASGVAMAYALGKIPKMETVAFAYMWSRQQHLGPGIGAFHPHMMVYAPYYENPMIGGHDFGTSHLPFVSDDAGTPFAVVVIPVHGEAEAGTKTAARAEKP